MGKKYYGLPGQRKTITSDAYAARQAAWCALPAAKQVHPMQALRRFGGQLVRDYHPAADLSLEDQRKVMAAYAKRVLAWVIWLRKMLESSGGRKAQPLFIVAREMAGYA